MLLLAPPSTRPPDRPISLTGPSSSAAAVARIAARHGCPPSVCSRVESCIRHSNRYDCRISIVLAMPAVFEAFTSQLRRHGADAVLLD
jgi:hypothetical protein